MSCDSSFPAGIIPGGVSSINGVMMYFNEPSPICYGSLDSFTLEELAEANGVDVRTVRDWIATSELKAFSVSRNPKSNKPRLRVAEDDWLTFRELRSTRKSEKPSRRRSKLPEVTQWV